MCDRCGAKATIFIGIGSNGIRLCDWHYEEYKRGLCQDDSVVSTTPRVLHRRGH